MLTEDYCSQEVVKMLKEKGFKIPQYYNSLINMWQDTKVTHQMAMKWLRGNNIIIIPQPEYFSCDKCESWGIDIWAGDNYEKSLRDFPTYEEAIEAALKWCTTELL